MAITRAQPTQRISLPFIICGLAALFYVYDYFIQVAPSVMTHQLMRNFHLNAAQLGILSAAFYYSYTIMQIPAGLLLDRIGARKLLTFAVLVSAAGVTLFGSTHSLMSASFARFLIGLGSSFAFISALFLVARWFAHRHFAVIAGFIQLAGCLGSVFGEAPLAATINHFGWREVTIVTGLATFGLAIVYWLVIRDGEPSTVTGEQNTLANEWQRLRYLRKNAQVWWTASSGLVSWVPVATIGALWGVPYLMQVYHLTNTEAGQLCSLLWLALGFGSPALGWYSNHSNNRKRPMLICFAIGLAASILFIYAPALPLWLTAIALIGLGLSASTQALTFSLIKDNVPIHVFGTASGVNNMAAIIGGGISQPLVGLFLNWQWQGHMHNHIPTYSNHSYQIALLVLPIAAIIALAIVYFKIRETHCRT